MKGRQLIQAFITASLLWGTGVQKTFSSDKIQAFFNNEESSSYTDPYRHITKPGKDLEAIIIDAIERANSSISVAVQELRLPNIAKALVRKQKEGVQVRVVLENDYNNNILNLKEPTSTDDPDEHESSRYIELFTLIDKNRDGKLTKSELYDRDAIYILQQNNIPIKDDTSDGSFGSGLMHHKFIIIDGSEVVLSTANFTLSDMHGDFLNTATTGNANSMMKLQSKKLASFFQQEFDTMWNGTFGSKKSYRGPQTTYIGGSSITVQFSPTSKIRSWDDSVNGLIGKTLASAQSEVFMSLFVFSDQKISNVLKEKYESNHQFDLGVLVEPKFAYRNYSELLDMWGLELLDENCQYAQGNNPWSIPLYDIGVPILPRGDMLHHKFAVVDESTVIVGSQNWSDSANHTNDEYIIVIKNKAVAKQYKQEFNRLEKNSNKGPTKSLLKRIHQMEMACSRFF